MNTYRNHGLKAEIDKRKEIQPRNHQASKEGVHDFEFGDIAFIQIYRLRKSDRYLNTGWQFGKFKRGKDNRHDTCLECIST